MKRCTAVLLVFHFVIGTLYLITPNAWAQSSPRIDTFPAPNGKWSIDHHSKDNGWEKSYLALRNSDSVTSKWFATIDAAVQGAPIWSPDSRLVVFNTGYSTYLTPKVFQISQTGTVKEIIPFTSLFSNAQRSGRVPKPEEQDYETGHHYLRCRYYDNASKAFWFTYHGDYALKGPNKPVLVQKNFIVKLDAASLTFSFHDELPRPLDPAPPPRPASISLRATGTGFVIDRAGHVMTCHHVVDGASFIKLDSETASYNAFVVFTAPELDVAVLQAIELPSLDPLPLGLSIDLELAEEVFTIGFPNTTIQGFTPKFTRGEISALAGPADDPNYVQISTPVQPGNSGGALVSNDGIVIGIVATKLDAALTARVTGDIAQNVNYALKVSKLSRLLEKWNLQLPAAKPAPNTKQAVQRVKQSTLRISTYGK